MEAWNCNSQDLEKMNTTLLHLQQSGREHSNSTFKYSHYNANDYFFPPQNQPLTIPVIPLEVACSIFSLTEGISIWFKARSKNNGRHGMGSKLGGNGTRLGFFVTKVGSSKYWSRRSERGWNNNSKSLIQIQNKKWNPEKQNLPSMLGHPKSFQLALFELSFKASWGIVRWRLGKSNDITLLKAYKWPTF